MRFSVLSVYHAVYDLLKVLLPCGGRAFYVLVAVHSKIPLISLILLARKIKIKEIEMSYINFFENNSNYFFKYDGLRRTALIEYSHHKESRVVL